MGDEPSRKALRRLPFALEEGIYLQAEAALLTGLPRTTVRRWLQLERGEASLDAIAEQPLVSFLDLISLRAVAALRKAGLSLPRIRRGADYMRTRLGIDHPLAMEALRTNGFRIYFVQDDALLAIDAGGQLAAQVLIDQYLQDVRYTSLGRARIATTWEPAGVTIDPELQRGAPCVAGSRVQLAVLQRYVDAGDSPEHLAELFDLDVEKVKTGLGWYAGLRARAA